MRRLLDWLHDRSGYRAGLETMLDEPLPPGTGWAFTLGSVLLFLVSVQLLTGGVLTLYYAPTPDHAHDSVRYITNDVRLGWLVRGLHFFGASFIVVFAGLHLLRVIVLGSYKKPRELTWLSGVALLMLILAFALTGYLLPWDQRAYWATVVTINIAASAPVIGDLVATVMRGGPEIGALTLSRWYAAHVVLLPGAFVALIVAHIFLMRKHGISGPIRPREGRAPRFYPDQAAKDLAVVAMVAAVLLTLVVRGLPPLERVADPTDATYVPRPEWYFLSLFQLLKYFPGRLEIVASQVIPGLAIGVLAMLPWLDRSTHRDPRRRPFVMAGALLAVGAMATLTTLGWNDRPEGSDGGPAAWRLREVAGGIWMAKADCTRCHGDAGMTDPVGAHKITRPPDWLAAHVADPEVIAPGVREAPTGNEREVAAIVAYVRRLGDGDRPPTPAPDPVAAQVYARYCVSCHVVDGDGGKDGPDLSHAGRDRSREWLRRWVAQPTDIKADAEMPAFGKRLRPEELDAIVDYLAQRR
jgi:ubiquinol-cytochrome c reductase cytochrome b subunit